eukprot:scaffold16451_cov40-Tisochrysis_lutea.AAC.3
MDLLLPLALQAQQNRARTRLRNRQQTQRTLATSNMSGREGRGAADKHSLRTRVTPQQRRANGANV